MVRLFAAAGLCVYLVAVASMFVQAAPATRRQLGNLECNIDRGEIVFHVAKLGATVDLLGHSSDLVAANATAEADVDAMRSGAEGAGLAIKNILLALINGEAASPDLRDAVGGNLTQIALALQDLSSMDTTTTALLAQAQQQLTNAALAGDGVVNNCK